MIILFSTSWIDFTEAKVHKILQVSLVTFLHFTFSDRIEVVKIHGNDPSRDLRYNANTPHQGVSHGERVTIETKFYPENLRLIFELELSLFMVCMGEQYQSLPDVS